MLTVEVVRSIEIIRTLWLPSCVLSVSKSIFFVCSFLKRGLQVELLFGVLSKGV